MITTADAELARTLRLLRNQGMEQRYANEIVGANMRLTDVAAAIGRVQLGQLPEWTEQRQANAKFLDSRITEMVTPPVADGARHVYHQYTVRVRGDRDAAQKVLDGARRRQRGLLPDADPPAPAVPRPPMASRARGTCPRPSGPRPRCMSLPIFPSLDARASSSASRTRPTPRAGSLMTSTPKLRAGLIGLGAMGRNHARVLQIARRRRTGRRGRPDRRREQRCCAASRSSPTVADLIALGLDYAVVCLPDRRCTRRSAWNSPRPACRR